MTTSIQLADIAEQAAHAVSSYLVDAFENPGAVEYKADFHDVVTVHDKASQAQIADVIFAGAPDSLIVAEESSELLTASGTPSEPGSNDVVWYVDPIDGTSNFASGIDHWCVSIAAARGREIIAAVIHQPTTGITYHADETGAYRNGVAMRALEVPIKRGVFATSYPSSRLGDESDAQAFLRLVRSVRTVRRPGSTALELADVAAGHLLAAYNRGTNPWDVAAGLLLVQRAGGFYFGFDDDGGRPSPAPQHSDGTKLYTDDLVHARNYAGAGTKEAAAFCIEILGRPDIAAQIQ
ncbi:MAG: inositol monophosphatase family protein [Ancrocorticia sp.]|uniref:inositol monophosphatase family protein n=1 Tax=Ancrocorticia sp. TaxID=2593684 RepID=UPI003F9324F6